MIYVVTHARQGEQVLVNLIRHLDFPILFGSNQCVKQQLIALLSNDWLKTYGVECLEGDSQTVKHCTCKYSKLSNDEMLLYLLISVLLGV